MNVFPRRGNRSDGRGSDRQSRDRQGAVAHMENNLAVGALPVRATQKPNPTTNLRLRDLDYSLPAQRSEDDNDDMS